MTISEALGELRSRCPHMVFKLECGTWDRPSDDGKRNVTLVYSVAIMEPSGAGKCRVYQHADLTVAVSMAVGEWHRGTELAEPSDKRQQEQEIAAGIKAPF